MDGFRFITESPGESGKLTAHHTRRTIRAHVMRDYWVKSFQRRSRYQASTLPQSKKSTTGKTARRREVPSDTLRNQAIGTSNGCIVEEGSKVSEIRQEIVLEAATCTFSGVVDTFAYAGCTIDLKSYRLFHHYLHEFHVVLCDPIQPVLPSGRHLACSVAIQTNDYALLHTICMVTAGHESIMRGEISEPKDLFRIKSSSSSIQHEALHHKVAALEALNHRLGHGVTEAMILCVTLFLTVEAIIGDNSPALLAHLHGLERMIELYGGHQLLSPSVASHVYLADIKAAQALQSRPSFPLPPHLQRRAADCTSTSVTAEDLSGLLMASHFVSPPLFLTLQPDLQKCIHYTRHLTTISIQPSTLSNSTYSIDDFVAHEHILLSLPFQTPLSNLEDCIRITLLLYINTALYKIPLHFHWVVALVSELQTSLRALNWSGTAQTHANLLLWMTLLGRFSAGLDTTDGHVWWDTRIQSLSHTLGLYDWSSAKSAIQGYLYVDRVYGKPWKRIWTDVVLFRTINVNHHHQQEQHLNHPCSYCR